MSTLDPRDRTQLSVEDIYHDLKAKLGDYTPDFELRVKAELAYRDQPAQGRSATP